MDGLDGSRNDGEQPTVFVISTEDIGAVQQTTEAYYVSRLFAADFETHVFGPLSSEIPDARSHSYPFSGLVGVFLLNVVFFPYWVYLLRRYDPNVVYGYQNVISPLVLGSWGSSTVTVLDFQADFYDQSREFSRREEGFSVVPYVAVASKYVHMGLVRTVDAIVTLSEPLKDQLCDRYRIPERRVHVVPLGVDTEAFHPLDSDNPELRLTYVGSIAAFRGLDTVVEALSLLDEDRRRDITFEVYGTGDTAVIEALRAQANDADPPVNITWHGYIAHEKLPEKVARCDVAVSPLPPLRSFQVSCPAKIFEYLAMGLPIIATSIAPHQRFLTDGVDAILVNSEDPEAFAQAIKYCLDNPERLEEMSSQARDTALVHDWQSRYEQIRDIIRLNAESAALT